MKLFCYALLLALGVISGHKCEDTNDSSDISSHLHLATKATKAAKVTKVTKIPSYFISEFQPNPPSADPSMMDIELSGGSPGEVFDGCIWSIEADPVTIPAIKTGTVDRRTIVSGTFDANGLLVVTIPDIENPSFTIVLSDSSCPAVGFNVIDNGPFGGGIYDAIGVPDSSADEGNLAAIRTALGNPPGTDFNYTGDEPKLVFRDASVGDLYAVNDPPNGVVKDANGGDIDASQFSGGSPLEPSFGLINPTLGSSVIFISEFQPNPPSADPSMMDIELSGGSPGEVFNGCIWSIEADPVTLPLPPLKPGRVDRRTIVSGTFDANGLLVVTIPDIENPSFTIVLSDSSCPAVGFNVIDNGPFGGGIYDAIGVPDSSADEGNLAAIRTALGNPRGTDFKFTGDEPKLVFRDASVGDLYAVNDPPNGVVKDANGGDIDASQFSGGNPLAPSFGLINPTLGSGVTGDPHIHTLDGGHYTLLREGSFLLWRFGLPQPHVEWQIFAHYAGRQSFTKGLLLVDTSGSEPSSMEITSERCEWQTQSSSKKWSSVNSTGAEVLLSGPSSHMKLVGNQRKDMKKIQLFLAGEKTAVATLKVMCRQGRHINMKLYMGNQKWKPFVSGELKGEKGKKNDMPTSKGSMLQLAGREDHEFEVTKTWAELGGSSHAQQYLQNLDAHQNVAFIQPCDPRAQADARALCQKHLGTAAHSSYLEECVYDVCSGAGEVEAEMAAEMLKF